MFHRAMFFADFGALLADARRKLQQIAAELRCPRQQRDERPADIGAIEIEQDAVAEMLDFRLLQTGDCTDVALFGTLTCNPDDLPIKWMWHSCPSCNSSASGILAARQSLLIRTCKNFLLPHPKKKSATSS